MSNPCDQILLGLEVADPIRVDLQIDDPILLDPTPTSRQIILQEPCNDGASAYEIAVENGFVGTEQEWLDSLIGEQGPPGDPGQAGSSAYEIAVENGFSGTEQEWLDSLIGEQGEKGDTGDAGASAYEIAVDNGFSGTEQEWLDSLVGPPGQDGIAGSGTQNYLAKFTPDGDTLGNSIIRDNGTEIGIGTAPVAGTRLVVQGTGTTNATDAFVVKSGQGTNRLTVRGDGAVLVSTNITNSSLSGTLTYYAFTNNGNPFSFSFNAVMGFVGTTNATTVIANRAAYRSGITYNIPSGPGEFATFGDYSTINQTGGANGTTRGLHLKPTLTSAFDWRGIEINVPSISDIFIGRNTGSSALDIQSTTQGFLPPRMTTAQRDAIGSPALGLQGFDIDVEQPFFRTSSGFRLVGARAFTPTGTADTTGTNGDTAYDSDWFYVRTSAGWKRVGISSF